MHAAKALMHYRLKLPVKVWLLPLWLNGTQNIASVRNTVENKLENCGLCLLRKQNFLLYSGKDLDLLKLTPIFRTFQIRPPRLPVETITLFKAHYSTTLFAAYRLQSVSPVEQFILFCTEPFSLCVGYLLLLITETSFYPCPACIESHHCALLGSAKRPEHKSRHKCHIKMPCGRFRVSQIIPCCLRRVGTHYLMIQN